MRYVGAWEVGAKASHEEVDRPERVCACGYDAVSQSSSQCEMARGITRLTLSVGVVPHGSLGLVAKDSHEVIGIVPVAGVARLHDIADGLAIHPGFLVASAIGGVLDLAESLERILFNGKGIGVVLVEKGLVPLGLCLAAEYLDELGDISPAGDLGDAK